MEHIKYPGTIDVFRAAMDRIAPRGEWVSPDGTRVQCSETEWQSNGQRSPYYGFWVLRLYSENPKDRGRCATIAAFYLPNKLWTTLIFLDGLDPTHSLREPRSMGEVLVDLYWAVLTEVNWAAGRSSPQAEVPVTMSDRDGESKRYRGHPGLDHEELVYRLTKAQEGEEIRQQEPDKTWKEIAHEIGWKYGYAQRGVKLLEDARKRLKRADQTLLTEVERRRKKKKEK